MKRRVYEHKIKVKTERLLKDIKRGRYTADVQKLFETTVAFGEICNRAISAVGAFIAEVVKKNEILQ